MDIKEALNRAVGHLDLSTAEMQSVMRQIMTGQCTEAQVGGFLVAMRMKSESSMKLLVLCRCYVSWLNLWILPVSTWWIPAGLAAMG